MQTQKSSETQAALLLQVAKGRVSIGVFTLIVASTLCFLLLSKTGDNQGLHGATWTNKSVGLGYKSPRPEKDTLSSPMHFVGMLESFSAAKDELINNLKQDYGPETFVDMFVNTQQQENEKAVQNELSKARMRRKLKLKVLRAHVAAAQHPDANPHKFVWVTAGNSRAAGHGNLLNESYTALIERQLRKPFQSIGLQFEGRNYGISALSGGIEAGTACLEQVYGADIDLFVWNFGLTDGGEYSYANGLFSHLGIHPNRPAALVFPDEGIASQPRLQLTQEFENRGLTMLRFLEEGFIRVAGGVPDSFGLTQAELDAMPPFVRNFKCSGALERGEPYCDQEKYSPDIDVCPVRPGRVSWHLGWKYHALIGNILVLAFVELLEESLKELVDGEQIAPELLIKELKRQEDLDYNTFFESDLIEGGEKIIRVPEGSENPIDLKLIFRQRGICRVSYLPSESRYKGIMFEGPELDFYTARNQVFNTSFSLTGVEPGYIPNVDSNLRLVNGAWGWFDVCHVPFYEDLKQSWLVTGQEGWQGLTLPNDREVQYYNLGRPLKGLIMVCTMFCAPYECAFLGLDNMYTGELEFEVNGVKVVNATSANQIWQDCFFLQHDGGLYFQANAEDKFEIKVRVNNPAAIIRFTSFTVW